MDKISSTNIRELLFGVSWLSTLKTLGTESKLGKKLEAAGKNTKSLVFTYAITIALRHYDSRYLAELKKKLETKFGLEIDAGGESLAAAIDSDDYSNHIYNLQYTIQGSNIVYSIGGAIELIDF